MKLTRCDLPKDQFFSLARKDKAVLVRTANLHNEIAILLKILVWSIPINRPNSLDQFQDAEFKGRNCQSFFFARLLIGKLFEFHKFITKSTHLKGNQSENNFDPKSYFVRYKMRMPDSLQETYDRCTEDHNFFKILRDNFSFHSELGPIYEMVEIMDQDSLVFFSDDGTASTNNMFYFAESAVNMAAASKAGKDNFKDNMDYIYDEVQKKSKDSLQVLTFPAREMLVDKFDLDEENFQDFDADNLLGLREFSIPYFVA